MDGISSKTPARAITRTVALSLLLAASACQKAPTPGAQQPAAPGATGAPEPGAPEPGAPEPGAPNITPDRPTAAPGALAPPSAESTGPAGQPAPPPAAGALPGASPPAAPEAPAAPPPAAPVVVPAGTHLTVRLDTALGSASSAAGEGFSGSLVNGITIRGTRLIPRHAMVIGKVVNARAAGKFAGGASLSLRVESVAGRSVETSLYSQQVEGKGKRTGAIIGGTAVAGALLGALAGHGRGAAIGAVAGGGVGTLGAAETGNNRDVVLPAGTLLTFKLRQSISVQPQP